MIASGRAKRTNMLLPLIAGYLVLSLLFASSKVDGHLGGFATGLSLSLALLTPEAV